MTEGCLRSWLAQEYPGQVQTLFGVAEADDPVCLPARRLLKEFPEADAQLVVCGPLRGANLKVSKLVELDRLARNELVIISDADVKAPPDLLANIVAPLREEEVGLVNCFYRLANSPTLAMRWEALATNADFWSQVLQARSLKPLDFALGAVMATRRRQLREIGGFEALADCLADDYQLGRRIAERGYRIELSPVVVECWSTPIGWAAVWKHQLRWARTIRVCQPAPYFFSILSNATLWPLFYLAINPTGPALLLGLACWFARMAAAVDLQARLEGGPQTTDHRPQTTDHGPRTTDHGPQTTDHRPQTTDHRPQTTDHRPQTTDHRPQTTDHRPLTTDHRPEPTGGGRQAWGWRRVRGGGLALLKDLLQAGIWVLAFTGNSIEWRSRKMRLRRDGSIVEE
jgi:ceramide glucosyltransferase